MCFYVHTFVMLISPNNIIFPFNHYDKIALSTYTRPNLGGSAKMLSKCSLLTAVFFLRIVALTLKHFFWFMITGLCMEGTEKIGCSFVWLNDREAQTFYNVKLVAGGSSCEKACDNDHGWQRLGQKFSRAVDPDKLIQYTTEVRLDQDNRIEPLFQMDEMYDKADFNNNSKIWNVGKSSYGTCPTFQISIVQRPVSYEAPRFGTTINGLNC